MAKHVVFSVMRICFVKSTHSRIRLNNSLLKGSSLVYFCSFSSPAIHILIIYIFCHFQEYCSMSLVFFYKHSSIFTNALLQKMVIFCFMTKIYSISIIVNCYFFVINNKIGKIHKSAISYTIIVNKKADMLT